MDVWNILSVGASTVLLLALIHVAVFHVVKTMYPPRPVRAQPPVVMAPPPPVVETPAPPQAPDIPLVTTKLPPPVDTRDPGPARPSSVTASKEGQSNLGPMSGASN